MAGAKITKEGDKLNVPDQPIVPFIEGDGTGPDIWNAAVKVFDAAVEKAYGGKKKIEWKEVLAGGKSHDKTGEWLPNETLEAFKEQVKQAGQASPEGEGMWADAELHDLVQWNNGFRTGLIGTKEQIVERIRQLDAIGIDIVLLSASNYTQDLPQFGEELLLLIREAQPIDQKKIAVEYKNASTCFTRMLRISIQIDHYE
jgi:hypothetical protein